MFRQIQIYTVLMMALSAVSFVYPQDFSKFSRNIDFTSEKSLSAKIDISTGQIHIENTAKSRVFAGDFFFDERPPSVSYKIVGSEGQLTVRFTEKTGKRKYDYDEDDNDYDIDLDEIDDKESYLSFTDRIPLSLNMDLGIIKGDLDLGGLRIQNCQIATAVGKTDIDFSKPNLIRMNQLKIENGVGKLHVFNLGNANFSEFDFEAGVGSYKLDFGGKISEDATLDLEIGMGKLEIYLPKHIGVHIKMDDSFLTSVDIDDVYKRDGDYYNDLWDTNAPQWEISIDAGISKVDIEWID